jgi:hypothetical protein
MSRKIASGKEKFCVVIGVDIDSNNIQKVIRESWIARMPSGITKVVPNMSVISFYSRDINDKKPAVCDYHKNTPFNYQESGFYNLKIYSVEGKCFYLDLFIKKCF